MKNSESECYKWWRGNLIEDTYDRAMEWNQENDKNISSEIMEKVINVYMEYLVDSDLSYWIKGIWRGTLVSNDYHNFKEDIEATPKNFKDWLSINCSNMKEEEDEWYNAIKERAEIFKTDDDDEDDEDEDDEDEDDDDEDDDDESYEFVGN